MALILLTGYVVAQSPPVSRFLDWLASKPRNQGQALALTIVVASIASLINWGFGLVVAAIMARFIGKRLENIDYAILVSAGYAGFIVWASGSLSSIALAVSTPAARRTLPSSRRDRYSGTETPSSPVEHLTRNPHCHPPGTALLVDDAQTPGGYA
jgi:short-chain fatty acids transporter